MKTVMKLSLFLALFLALALPGPASAKGLNQEFVFGGSYVLQSGETLNDDLVVFGGNVTLEEDSQVNGDLIIMGGNLDASGEIDGSITGFGGNISLGDTAVVSGDVNMFGGGLDQAPGAVIEGEVGREFRGPFSFNFPRNFRTPVYFWEYSPISLLTQFIWFMLRVFLWAALAVLLVMFLPNQVGRTAQAAVSQPLVAGGVGLLTAVVAPLLLVGLALTILLIPVSLLAGLILVIAWAFGVIALGVEVGRRMAHNFNQVWAPPVSAGIGTFVLILVVNGIGALVPCVGWIVPLLVGVVGLGATLLTRFGTAAYPPAPPRPAHVPPPPPPSSDWPPVPAVTVPPAPTAVPEEELPPGSEEWVYPAPPEPEAPPAGAVGVYPAPEAEEEPRLDEEIPPAVADDNLPFITPPPESEDEDQPPIPPHG